jgi:hypothetical protein
MLTPGTVLQNRYRIVSKLGQGGMGAVYRAWDMRLSVPIALKEMTPQPGLGAELLGQLRQQFHQEATVLARLIHPHLVRVTDFFEEGGNAYLVMDLVEGESLADRITRLGPLPEADVLTWAKQLLGALVYCHNQGIIHRDIKPQNVIIRPDGRAVLVDFGLVKLWDPSDPRTKTVMRGTGTPEYAPPEQYEADVEHTDGRSDVYGLGATLYHALVGQAPPTATLRMAAPERFVPVRNLNPNVSPATERTILRALELRRSDRWQSATEMAAALEGRDVPSPARPPGHVTPAVPQHEKTEVLPRAQPAAPAIPAAPARRRVPAWVWILGGAAIFSIVLCAGAIWAFGALARYGNEIATVTAQAQATITAQAQEATVAAQAQIEATGTARAQAAATAQAAEETAVARAQATSEALIAQSTAEAQAQATSTPRAAPATATVMACIHQTDLAPHDWNVVVCDNFGANVRDWPEGDYDGDLITGDKFITSGRYRWEANAIDSVIWWSVPDMDSVSDFYLTAKARRVSGVEDSQYGMIFRRSDKQNYGLFKIEDSQYFKFAIRHEGEWDTVIDWTESSAIRPGETNRLTVIAVDSHFTFYINDQYVGEADEDRLGEGEAGLAIELLDSDDAAVFEFDDFEVRAP